MLAPLPRGTMLAPLSLAVIPARRRWRRTAASLTFTEKRMDKELEARIRTRAYHIWENDPSPEGRAEDHWEEARRQIEAEGVPDGAAVPQPADQSAEREHGSRIAPEQRLQEMTNGDVEPPRRAKRSRNG
jgi:hypothetical protein